MTTTDLALRERILARGDFDDVQLERYGQSRCPTLQPVLSGAHFFGTMAIMPYKMGLSGPFEMTSNYGYYRPGSPTPCVGRRLPWEWDAAGTYRVYTDFTPAGSQEGATLTRTVQVAGDYQPVTAEPVKAEPATVGVEILR